MAASVAHQQGIHLAGERACLQHHRRFPSNQSLLEACLCGCPFRWLVQLAAVAPDQAVVLCHMVTVHGVWSLVVEVAVVVSRRRRSSTHWRLALHWRSIRRSSASSTTVPSRRRRSAHTSSWSVASSSRAAILSTSWWASSTPHRTSSSTWRAIHHGVLVVWHGWHGVAILIHGLSTT
jgi:hypothetical protein